MPRGRPRKKGTLAGELERISKELAQLTVRVKEAEGVKNAIDAFMTANRSKATVGSKPPPVNGRRRRRRRTAAEMAAARGADAQKPARRRGRPRRTAAAS